MIIQHPPFWEYDTIQFNSNEWLGMYTAMSYNNKVHGQSRSIVLRFPGSGTWCHADMAGSSWLHRCGMGCHRHWYRGIPLNSRHGRNSWSLVHLGCQCCSCSECGLHVLCRWEQCRLCHWEAVSSWSLQCGSCATWGQCWLLWHCIHKGVFTYGALWNHCWCILDSCSVVGHVSQ